MLAAGVSAFALLQSLVVPVLPTIADAACTPTQNTVTWVLTAYLLSASMFTPILGRLGDMVGKETDACRRRWRRWPSGRCWPRWPASIGVMIVARVIQGIGGGVMPLSFGIIRDEFPREKVTGAVGVIAALTAVGGGVGHRAGRPDRRRARLPLAVLAAR